MGGDLFKKENDNIDKLYISKGNFVFDGKVYHFNSDQELSNIIIQFFMNSSFNIITIFKKITKNTHYSFVKSYIIEDLTSDDDLYIICDKEYLNALRYSLREVGFDINLPKELKKKK